MPEINLVEVCIFGMKVKKQIMLNLEENGLLIQMTQKEKDTYLDTKNLVIEYENIYSAKDIDFEE